MGYWVINKNLESHLFISEGLPWGMCYSLSSSKTLHIRECLQHPQCLSTQLLLSNAKVCMSWHSTRSDLPSSPSSEQSHHAIHLDVSSSTVFNLGMFSYTIHDSFLAVTWEKILLAAISSNRSITVFAENRCNMLRVTDLSGLVFFLGLKGKQECR